MVLGRAALLGGCCLRASASSSSQAFSAHGYTPCAMVSMAVASQQEVSAENVDQQIIGLCTQRQLKEALFHLNQQVGMVGFSAFACLLQSCSAMSAPHEAKYLHFHMLSGGLDQDPFLANMAMRMYDKCGSLLDARNLFDNMHHRNIVSWNMIIGAYSSRGHKKSAFCLLCHMLKEEKVKPDKVTCITILSVCNSPSAFTDIRLLYGLILEIEVEADVTIGNVLINAFSQSSTLTDAFAIFDRMPTRNVVSWNTLIAACAIPGHENMSLSLFWKMHAEDILRDKATYVGTLNACANRSALLHGRLVHFEIVKSGLDLDVLAASALVKMYGKCESLADGFWVFESMRRGRDVVLWTTMIASYIQQGHNKQGLQLYQEMQREGVRPNNITFVTVLSACTNPGFLMDGKRIRNGISDADIDSDIILSNALITMYQKCGSFADAEQLFLRMPRKDVVSCTAMIAAFAEQGRGYEALFLYEKMGRIGVKPDRFTFSSVLDACASIAALIEGRLLYHTVIENGFEWDGVIGNALVSLYGESGIVEDAYSVFLKLSEQDWVSWSAIIGAYANHGYSKEAFNLFQEMQQQGLKPTVITFVSVLSACSHAGLLNEGYEYFTSMTRALVTTPTSEHYMCMIDMISRAGCLHDAEQFISRMPLQPNAILWNTLLGACRVHGVVDGGHWAANHILELDPQCEAAYVVLANLYASAGQFEEALTVRKAMEICTSSHHIQV
eukprot:c10236_g1_i1 orf=183-2363(+)